MCSAAARSTGWPISRRVAIAVEDTARLEEIGEVSLNSWQDADLCAKPPDLGAA
jgi:hypothetical protein